jgi:signal transduction histidine kinase
MGIAHEVSTPLAVIVGRAEQLEGRLQGDARSENGVRVILKQADQIQQIIRRFLDLARGGPPSLGEADCADIARAAAASVAHRFAKANVALRTDIPQRVPRVRCDRALLEHAIVNLLLNACDASEPGAHVELQVRPYSQRVAFVVADEGTGISAEHAARVTEPFFTTKLEKGGTGLGLAIAGEIAKSHRGELTLGPNAPRGTRACISIPVAVAEGEHHAQPG